MQGEAERAGFVWPGGGKAKGELIAVCRYLVGECGQDGARGLLGMHSHRTKDNSMSMVRRWNRGPERLWYLYQWRYSKMDWTKPQAI